MMVYKNIIESSHLIKDFSFYAKTSKKDKKLKMIDTADRKLWKREINTCGEMLM